MTDKPAPGDPHQIVSGKGAERYEIGTIALPAYIILYRNVRTTGRWYIHRGYTNQTDALEVATSFKRVGMDVTIVPMIYDENQLMVLNAF